MKPIVLWLSRLLVTVLCLYDLLWLVAPLFLLARVMKVLLLAVWN